jgi:hypothetical protein
MTTNCKKSFQLDDNELNQILNVAKDLNNWYGPKDSLIYWHDNYWAYNDGSASKVPEDILHITNIKKIEELKNKNLITEDYFKRLNRYIEENKNWNLGSLLSNNIYGNIFVRFLPNKQHINYYIWDDWLGDEEYLNMTDEDFDNFLKSRIFPLSKNKSVIKIPYFEISLPFQDCSERESYEYQYYFIKTNGKNWLLNSIKIEKID